MLGCLYIHLRNPPGWATLVIADHAFAPSNGIRQGDVLSPVLFTIYIDKLSVASQLAAASIERRLYVTNLSSELKLVRDNLLSIYIDAERFVQVGHWVFLEFPLCRALGYADDVVLLTPSPAVLRISTNTTFSLTKTQFICFSCSLSSSCRGIVHCVANLQDSLLLLYFSVVCSS